MDDLILLINPDILEILLSEIHNMSCVLNGKLSLSLRLISEAYPGGESYYNTETIFQHGSLQALDPELLLVFREQLYIPDDEWKNLIINNSNKLRVKGINMDFVKYSHIDFNLFEYNTYLYNKLSKQTDSFDPVELGKRIVLVPGTLPDNYDDFIKIYEPLTIEFKVFARYLKLTYELDFDIKDVKTMSEVVDDIFFSCGITPEQFEIFKKEVITFMLKDQEVSGLTMEFLEKYREKYEACITVTPDNLRLYTRARFILNIFIDLNEYVLPHIVNSTHTSNIDTVSNAHEYLGMTARNILMNLHTPYPDEDDYPTFSNLYKFGSIESRQFPESTIYTNLQQVCYCNRCKPFLYTAQLYEAKNGDVYVLVSLKVEYSKYLDYFVTRKCFYNLFLHDKEYHYQRVEALAHYSAKLEEKAHKTFQFDLAAMHAMYGNNYHNWFTTNYHVQRGILEADRLMQTIRDGD